MSTRGWMMQREKDRKLNNYIWWSKNLIHSYCSEKQTQHKWDSDGSIYWVLIIHQLIQVWVPSENTVSRLRVRDKTHNIGQTKDSKHLLSDVKDWGCHQWSHCWFTCRCVHMYAYVIESLHYYRTELSLKWPTRLIWLCCHSFHLVTPPPTWQCHIAPLYGKPKMSSAVIFGKHR